MSFNHASITWGANQLAAMVKNGTISFDNIVQRSFIWEKSRQSALIESMALSVPIPDVYAKQSNDGSGKRNSKTYDILDGKQRLTTIKQFIHNEFKLTELDPITYLNELTNNVEVVDISGCIFDELPEGLQEKIKNTRISVIYFDDLTKDEERELFKRLNAGRPLSTKSRTLASCNDIEGILEIGSHTLFDEMLTIKSKKNKNQVALVMKMWCMMNQKIENVSFESRTFNPLIEKTRISEHQKEEMIKVFDMIVDAHNTLNDIGEKKIAKKLYTETHIVSLIPFFKKAIENDISEEMMANWLVSFFDCEDSASVSDEYNEACGSGSAKPVSIMARNTILEESYNKFFAE